MRDSQFELVVMGLFHCVLTLGLLLTYLPFLDLRGAPAWIRVEDHLAILSLALLTGASCVVPAAFVTSVRHRWGQWSARLIAIAICALELWYLFIDRQLFRLTRLHLDWSIVGVLRQPRALEGIGLPVQPSGRCRCCSVPRLAWRRPFGRPRQLLPATLPGGSGGSSTLDGRLSRCLPSSAGPTQCSLQE